LHKSMNVLSATELKMVNSGYVYILPQFLKNALVTSLLLLTEIAVSLPSITNVKTGIKSIILTIYNLVVFNLFMRLHSC